MENSPNAAKNAGSITLANHLVLFVDVLGQREALRKLVRLPTTKDEYNEVGQVLTHTVEVVVGVREGFRSFFEALNRASQAMRSMPPELAAQVRAATRSEVNYFHFSDSIVISVPIVPTEGDFCLSSSGILTAVSAACFMQLSSLALGFSVRGGLEIGPGTRLEGGEIYGPALMRAYDLESKCADYPRVAVGLELVKLLHQLQAMPGDAPRQELARRNGRSALALIHQDEDGAFATDFLGKEFHRLHGGQERVDLVKSAIQTVERQYSKWHNERDPKLARRYAWLRRYVRSRAAVWGLGE